MNTASLLVALAPLGESYHVNLSLAYSGDNVTATIILKPKEHLKNSREKNFQLAGTVAEVEKQIAEQLPAAVNQIVDHTASLTAQAEKQIADEKAETAAEKEKKKPAPAKSPATPAAKSTPSKPAAGKKETAADKAKAALASGDPGEGKSTTVVAKNEADTTPPPAGEKKLSAAEQALLTLNAVDDTQPL